MVSQHRCEVSRTMDELLDVSLTLAEDPLLYRMDTLLSREKNQID